MPKELDQLKTGAIIWKKAHKEGLKAKEEWKQSRGFYKEPWMITEEEKQQIEEESNERYKSAYLNYWTFEERATREGQIMMRRPGGLMDIAKEFGYTMENKETPIKKWWWITLRPSREHKERFSDFMVTCLSYLNRNIFKRWTAAFEQKGTNNETMGQDYHIHIIAEVNDKYHKTKIIRDTKSSWSKFLNGDVPDAFLEVKEIKTAEQAHVKLRYITGHKKEEHKHAAVAIDPIWRKKMLLKDIYESDDFAMPELPSPMAQAL